MSQRVEEPTAPRRGRPVAGLVLSLLTMLLVVGLPSPARAAEAFVSSTASTGYQVDGTVYSTLVVADTVYVGGDFANAIAPDGTLVARKNLAAFNVTTGDLVTSFRADAASTVRAFATDGTNLFVGGAFKTLGGLSRSFVGKVNLVTGAVDPTFAPVANNSVRALLYKSGSLYVGGNFTTIDGAVRNRIAKLDATSGAGDSTFATSADASVYALKLSPAGDVLYVGGNFATLGSTARNGMAAVLPTTGAVTGPVFANAAKPTFALAVNEDGSTVFASGGSATNATAAWTSSTGVRRWRNVTDGDNQAMVYFRGEVYFGFHDGYQGNTAYKLLAADATTGAIDPTFKPTFDQFWGTWALDVSEKGLVVGGDFTSVGGLPTRGFARFLPTTTVPPVPPTTKVLLGPNQQWSYWDQGTRPTGWETTGFSSSSWPKGIPRLGYGDTFDTTIVGYGPSSTSKYITTYFRSAFDLASKPDGLQLLLSVDDGAVVYLNGTEVARSNLTTGTVTNTTTALTDKSAGAETALASYQISPNLLTTGTNVVAIEVHQFSRGSSDMGLDVELDATYNSSQTTNQPPTAAFTSTMNGLAASFDGTGSTDPDGQVAYWSWDFGDGTTGTGATATHTYATGGDYAVTLSVLDDQGVLATRTQTVSAVSPTQTVIARGSSWRWQYDGTTPAAGWNSPSFDQSTWSTGNAPLGFGDTSVITKIDSAWTSTTRPKTAYFSKTFTVSNPARVSQLLIDTVADDGVVVYVNGTEVGRGNMPAGTVTSSTSASSAVRTASAAKLTINASPDLLVAGNNVISAETHLNFRGTADATFDLTATVLTGNARPTAAFTSSVSQLTAAFDGSGSTDADGSVASYAWAFGDGTTGSGATPSHTYAASGTYPVTLTVTDNDDAVGSVTHNVTVVTADPTVIPKGSSWRYRYVATAPPVAWATNGFDDSSWSTGRAVVGFGDASVVTNIDVTPATSRPIAAQFRNTFQVADTTKVTTMTLSTVADDGVLIYVNGTEVGRSNLPAGTIAYTTYASAARSTATANASPVLVTVPTSLLVNGTNTIAVESHVNYRSTPSLTFDLTAKVQTG